MADPIWRKKYKNLLDSEGTWLLGIFGVADYESQLKIPKLKIADSI